MIVNPVLVGVIGTLLVEMAFVIIKDYFMNRRKTDEAKHKTF